MLKSGLASMTLRPQTAEYIIDLARECGLDGIEWGGDIHVPHGDEARAREVGRRTRDAGLAVASYGSYYRVGHSEIDGLPFANVLATAEALGAPLLRVWCGKQGSDKADAAYWQAIIDDTRRIVAMTEGAGMTLSFEFHAGTMNDNPAATRRLMEAVAHPDLRTHWQAEIWDGSIADLRAHNLAVLAAIRPWLSYVHTYQYVPDEEGKWAQVPLEDGRADWRVYHAALAGHEGYMLLEHVRHDDPGQVRRDAAVLLEIVG